MLGRSWNRVWVTFTVLLISFISYSSQIFLIWPWYGNELSVALLKLLVPFNLLVGMVFWNYALCVLTPPGGVPPGWKPNMAALENMEVKKGSHGPRYCKTCEAYKPPRAHHCRQCKTCVLKLDHHCPWIANCVGFHNQGHFLRFLLWVGIATSYHLAMVGCRAYDMYRTYYYQPTLSDVMFTVTNFATGGPVWVCVGMFGLYHLYLAAGNSTTIEGWEKDKVATLVRRGKIREIKYPYNIGFYNNLKAVLGPNPLLWLWPQPMRGDGLSYPVNPDAGGESAVYDWAGVAGRDAGAVGTPGEEAGLLDNVAEGLNVMASGGVPRFGTEERFRLSRGGSGPSGRAGEEMYLWPPQDPTRLPNPQRDFSSSSAFVYGEGAFNPALRPSSGAMRARQWSTPSEQAEDGDGDDVPLRSIRAHWQGHGQGSHPGSAPLHSHSRSYQQQRQQQQHDETERLYYNDYEYNDDTASEPSSSSSPEPYLSDYDDGEHGATGGEWARGERERRMRARDGEMAPHAYDTEEGMEMRPGAGAGAARVRRGSEGWEVRPAAPWALFGGGLGVGGDVGGDGDGDGDWVGGEVGNDNGRRGENGGYGYGAGATYTEHTASGRNGRYALEEEDGAGGSYAEENVAVAGASASAVGRPRGVARESLSAEERRAWEDRGRYRLYDPDE